MKKLLLVGSIVLVLGLLIAGATTSIFAHGPGDSEVTPTNGGAWEAMHEACENGDWEAMDKAAKEVHGGDFDHMHSTDGRMGGGMMGGGWGGMMGW